MVVTDNKRLPYGYECTWAEYSFKNYSYLLWWLGVQVAYHSFTINYHYKTIVWIFKTVFVKDFHQHTLKTYEFYKKKRKKEISCNNHTNGDDCALGQSLLEGTVYTRKVTEVVVWRMKPEPEREVQTRLIFSPLCTITSGPDFCDCRCVKVTKISGHSPPNFNRIMILWYIIKYMWQMLLAM